LSEGHICEKLIVVLLVFVVFIDEFSFLLFVPKLDNWGHLNNFINPKPGKLEEFEKINCCGWWRSVNPAGVYEILLSIMGIDPLSVFAASTHVPTLNLKRGNWCCQNAFLDVLE